MEHATHALGPIAVHAASYLWLIPLFPLVGCAINFAIGWRFERNGNKKLVHRVAVGAMMLSFATALVALYQLVQLPADGRFLQDTLWNLFTAGRMSVDFAFALDPTAILVRGDVVVLAFRHDVSLPCAHRRAYTPPYDKKMISG